ncbi:thioesterase family protein [Mesonia sp. K7]|uniref:acyl-CoA thioesterase n=1 Tax=Mesonia sp. K7 TaxID=2218606 RepID=UPI000DAAA05C|nr:thioesterase family protein [Mesonia sp. K7]PZD79579.1 acyl-CoA thioesterase [Mesonia sp. K7]
MKNFKSTLKVRYAETDQMGVVHHGNYAQYVELARCEWLEQFGISYKHMEANGIMLPVYEMAFKFIQPAFFDDEISIVTKLKKMPTFKIEFEYEIVRKTELLAEGSTTLIFVNSETRKPMRCPEFILKKINP